ncbi:hypothetical protein FQN60_005549, partial [Etheostoma spectabile]
MLLFPRKKQPAAEMEDEYDLKEIDELDDEVEPKPDIEELSDVQQCIYYDKDEESLDEGESKAEIVEVDDRRDRTSVSPGYLREKKEGKLKRVFVAQLLKEALDLAKTPVIDRAHRALRMRQDDRGQNGTEAVFTDPEEACSQRSRYYSATILQMSGVRDDRLAIWLAGLTTLTNFLFTLLGVWLVERVGRRKLTLGSIIGTCLSLSLLAIGFLMSAQHSPPVTFHPLDPSVANSTCSKYQLCEPCMLDPGCGFCYRENSSALLASSCVPVNKASTEQAAWGRCSNSSRMRAETYWAYNYCPTSYSWLVLLGLVCYLAAFAPGMGPMPWTINSEIYPLWARSTGNACAAGVNWTFNVLVSLTFLHLAQYFTYYGAFFLYSSMALLGFFFIYGCLPETKARHLEEIEALFENQLCSCGASDSDEGRQVEYIRVKVLKPLKTSPSNCCSASDWLRVKSNTGSLSSGWLRQK